MRYIERAQDGTLFKTLERPVVVLMISTSHQWLQKALSFLSHSLSFKRCIVVWCQYLCGKIALSAGQQYSCVDQSDMRNQGGLCLLYLFYPTTTGWNFKYIYVHVYIGTVELAYRLRTLRL